MSTLLFGLIWNSYAVAEEHELLYCYFHNMSYYTVSKAFQHQTAAHVGILSTFHVLQGDTTDDAKKLKGENGAGKDAAADKEENGEDEENGDEEEDLDEEDEEPLGEEDEEEGEEDGDEEAEGEEGEEEEDGEGEEGEEEEECGDA